MKRGVRGTPIRRQIIALIVLSQIVSTGLTLFLIQGLLGSGLSTPKAAALEVVGPFNTLVAATSDLDPEAANAAIASVLARDPRFAIARDAKPLLEDDLWPPGHFYLGAARTAADPDIQDDIHVVRRELFTTFPLTVSNYGVALQLNGDEWLVYTPLKTTPARLLPLFVLTLIVILLTIPAIAFVIWATGTQVAPLRKLAAAAEDFSRDLEADAAPESGSAEVRTVARAFNRMRARLKAMIEAKSHTLAAIGHDLRTPLTRMRLRLESGNVDAAALTRDVQAMEMMVNSALSFIRDGEAELHTAPIDLSALTQAICDDLVDIGHDVRFERAPRVVVRADPNLLRRALTNVIENGATYGSSVEVKLSADGDGDVVSIRVADDGPGLSKTLYEKAVEPFWRGDEARTPGAGGGFGLGLSITQTIIERHGGTLSFGPNKPAGLIVTLTLPKGMPAGE